MGSALAAGAVVACPAEGVWGLSCNPFDEAAVRYRDMLLFSVHFEAFQDSSGELADGTLSDEQVEANYRYRAARINEHLGTDWATS